MYLKYFLYFEIIFDSPEITKIIVESASVRFASFSSMTYHSTYQNQEADRRTRMLTQLQTWLRSRQFYRWNVPFGGIVVLWSETYHVHRFMQSPPEPGNRNAVSAVRVSPGFELYLNCCSVAKLHLTLQPQGLQPARLFCPQSPGVCSNSCPLSHYHVTR